MAIRTLVTRGFGNGTFNGAIALVVVRGYSIGSIVVPTVPGMEWTLPENRLHFTLPEDRLHYDLPENRLHYTLRNENGS